MKLIIDAGSTKTAVAAIDSRGEVTMFAFRGCNALMISDDELESLICGIVEKTGSLEDDEISSIDWYGAGCAIDVVCEHIADKWRSFLPNVDVMVASDLAGAAKALFPNSEGIACILGTGSNSCLWDGRKVVANVPPLGYILGDEGSGTRLGARLLADALRGILNDELSALFFEEYGVNKELALENVYRRPGANAWLASFVPFLKQHIEHDDIKRIVYEGFFDFLKRNVAVYPASKSFKLGFIGGVAYNFLAVLEEVCADNGYAIAIVSTNPLQNLINNELNKI